jgi:hypothetical protein
MLLSMKLIKKNCVLQTEVTVQWGALQGVAVCHQFVGTAIAGHHGTAGMFLPTIMGNADFSFFFTVTY